MKISYDEQLITTSLTVTFRGRSIKVSNIIIDTGSSHTVLSPDVLDSIGIAYENGDTVFEAYGIGDSVHFYSKKMDNIEVGNLKLKDFEIDVSVLPKDHSGLLGLDILLSNKFIVDLNKLELLHPAM
jgi:predicted aspartyl protease